MATSVVSIEHSVSKELVYGTIEAHLFLRLGDQFENQFEEFGLSAKELKKVYLALAGVYSIRVAKQTVSCEDCVTN